MRVFVRARTDAATPSDSSVWFELATDDGNTTQANTAVAFTATDDWEWLDLGPLNLHYNLNAVGTAQTIAAGETLRIWASAKTGEDIDIDVVYYLPVPAGGYGRWRFPGMQALSYFLVDGATETVARYVEGKDIYTPYDGVWEFTPGHVAHRVIMGVANGSNKHVITDEIKVRGLAIFPQTTGLLGTI